MKTGPQISIRVDVQSLGEHMTDYLVIADKSIKGGRTRKW